MDRQTDDEIGSQVWGTVTHPLERQRWKGHSKFTVILVVIVSSRPSGAPVSDPAKTEPSDQKQFPGHILSGKGHVVSREVRP